MLAALAVEPEPVVRVSLCIGLAVTRANEPTAQRIVALEKVSTHTDASGFAARTSLAILQKEQTPPELVERLLWEDSRHLLEYDLTLKATTWPTSAVDAQGSALNAAGIWFEGGPRVAQRFDTIQSADELGLVLTAIWLASDGRFRVELAEVLGAIVATDRFWQEEDDWAPTLRTVLETFGLPEERDDLRTLSEREPDDEEDDEDE